MVLPFNALSNDTLGVESFVDAAGLTARRAMTQVKLSSKYQIVIPEDVRNQLDLKPGQVMDVLILDGVLHVVPVRQPHELFGSLPGLDTHVERDDEDRV